MHTPLCANYQCHFPSAPIDACYERLRNLRLPCWGTWQSLTQRLFHPTILHKLLKTKKKGTTSPFTASQTPSMLRNVVMPSLHHFASKALPFAQVLFLEGPGSCNCGRSRSIEHWGGVGFPNSCVGVWFD